MPGLRQNRTEGSVTTGAGGFFVQPADAPGPKQRKASALLKAQEFTHDLDGVSPNAMLRESGFVLPSFYDREGNNVESLATNSDDPAAVWTALKGSPAHRAHVLGEGSFFGGQQAVGIGYAKTGSYGSERYWVMWVIISIHA